MAYATTVELQTFLGYAAVGAQAQLDRASRDVDRAIKCATYEVDGSDLPTDAVLLAALKSATLEQVAYQLEAGNRKGIRHGLQSGVPSSSSAGEVDLSRGQSVGGSSTGLPWLGDQSRWILQQAGVLGQAPYTHIA